LSGDESETAAVVEMEGVRFAWPGGRAFTLEVERFMVPRRRKILLLGPSGSGKSTLLSLVCGIVAPDAGRISIIGRDIALMSGGARDAFRAEHFGIIFQMFNLLPYGSALDNVMLPLSFSHKRHERAARSSGAVAEAERLLGALGLDAREIGPSPASALSVGQQQRVAAARALIGAPEIIVADEPTSALDRASQMQFLDLVFAEADAAGSAIVMVSHDETLAVRFDEVVKLADIARVTRGGRS
jgi:putative ABC transport system ATP-binding protein